MLYKHHVIDEYYEKKAKSVREAVGFFWAMRTRDHIQEIADSFIKSLDTLQEIDPETGDFLKYENDDIQICSQEFMDYMDIAMFNAIKECADKESTNIEKYKSDFSTKELQKLTFNLLDNNFKLFKELNNVEKKNYIRQCLWNYDDFKESFQYSLKRFTNELINKFMIIDYDEEEDENIENYSVEPDEFKCSVQDIYNLIVEFKEANQGLPVKKTSVEPHSEDELDLITKSMFAEDYINSVVDFLIDEVK